MKFSTDMKWWEREGEREDAQFAMLRIVID
jgi:hypothetical protein